MSYVEHLNTLRTALAQAETLQLNYHMDTRSQSKFRLQVESMSSELNNIRTEVRELASIREENERLRKRNTNLQRTVNSLTRH